MLDVVPSVANKEEIAEEIENEPEKPGSIDEIVAEEEKSEPPEWAGPTEPVKPPSKPLHLALMSCAAALHGCVTPTIGAAEAAKALGWTSTTYDGGGTPSTANSVILSAINSGADAILFTSINPSLIQQGLTAAKKAGVPVISASSGSSEPNPTVEVPPGQVWPLLDVSQSFVETGRQMADWVIKDSGESANALILTDKEYSRRLPGGCGRRVQQEVPELLPEHVQLHRYPGRHLAARPGGRLPANPSGSRIRHHPVRPRRGGDRAGDGAGRPDHGEAVRPARRPAEPGIHPRRTDPDLRRRVRPTTTPVGRWSTSCSGTSPVSRCPNRWARKSPPSC